MTRTAVSAETRKSPHDDAVSGSRLSGLSGSTAL